MVKDLDVLFSASEAMLPLLLVAVLQYVRLVIFRKIFMLWVLLLRPEIRQCKVEENNAFFIRWFSFFSGEKGKCFPAFYVGYINSRWGLYFYISDYKVCIHLLSIKYVFLISFDLNVLGKMSQI